MIPIVFSSNNYFVPYLSATIQSIIENANESNNYFLYILHENISNENITLFKKQIYYYNNFNIEFINVTKYIKDINFYVENRKSISKETYFRLLIPYIFTKHKKIIYLDCDMICCTDIAELYCIDIGDNMLASTRDLFGASSYYSKKNKKWKAVDKRISIKNRDNYFNPGLLLYNTEMFRQFISLEELLNFAVSKNWTWHDMDILNILCEDKIYYIPLEWNIYDIGSRFDFLPNYWKEMYLKAYKNIKIVHFADTYKPWINCHTVTFFELFWKYATRTPFIDEIIIRMKKDDVISPEGISRYILHNIKHRHGIGLYLIIKALFVWLFLRKK